MDIQKIKVMVVDDHPLVVEGIMVTLEGVPHLEITGSAGDADELFELLETDRPDILLLDISLPTLSGIEITRILAEKQPGIKVIIISANTDEESIREAIRAGARGYLPKNSRRSELTEAIEAVHRGDDYLGEWVSGNIVKEYLRQARSGETAFVRPKPDISERETEIIRMLANGLSHKEIADCLFISARTVESHRNNIMKKLNLGSLADLVKYAITHRIISL